MAKHFQVAVIGSQRAGLVAAALLAKRGVRVLLADHGEGLTTYRRKGLQLPLIPTLVPSLATSDHVRRVVDELGIGPDLRTMLTPLEPSWQVVMPEHRIEFRADRNHNLEELRREFPDVADVLAETFAGLFALDGQLSDLLAGDPPLPPTGLAQRFKLRSLAARSEHLAAPFDDNGLLAKIPAGHALRELILSPVAFFGHLPTESPSTFQAVRLIARYLEGAVEPPDRLGGLSSVLLDVAGRAGVEVHRGAVVKQLRLTGRRVDEIEIEEDRLRYTADFVVANTYGPFQDLLPSGKPHARFAAEQQALRPVGSLLTLNLVVRREVIPKGMGAALFLLNGRRAARDAPSGVEPVDPPLLLRRYPAQRGELGTNGAQAITDPDHAVLTIACPARTADIQRSPKRLAQLKSSIQQRVRRAVPFLDEFLTDESWAMDTAAWDAPRDLANNRCIDPLSVHAYYEPDSRPLLGVAGRGTKTYLKNVLHCGADIVPGLGIEGEYVAGLATANALSKMGGRRWRL